MLENLDSQKSLFSHLSYLSFKMKLDYIPEKYMTSILNFIDSLKSLVNVIPSLLFHTKVRIFVVDLSIGEYKDIIEGSIFEKTCKILQETRDMGECTIFEKNITLDVPVGSSSIATIFY